MKSNIRFRLAVVCLACLALPAAALPRDAHRCDNAVRSEPASANAAVTATLAEMPLTFEPNVGQTDERVEFLARTEGCGVFLTTDALVLALRRSGGLDLHDSAKVRPEPLAPAVLRMRLVGASASRPVGEEELETKANYFVGNDPDLWHTDVPTYARVRYPDVYAGVDLVYHGAHGALEYDVVVAPGADPSAIAVEWEGADAILVDQAGELVLKIDGGELRQQAPVLYQEDDTGGRRRVSGAFRALGGDRFGVEVGEYDRARPLVVDPVLTYSYTVPDNIGAIPFGVAVDATGAAYMTGETWSSAFTGYPGYDNTHNGGYDAFVAKLNPAGNAVVYYTYLGGYGFEIAWDIAVDASGCAYVAGYTYSEDFPKRASLHNILSGPADAFVTKLGPMGDALIYSTLLGGSGTEEAVAIACDSAGAVYVTGDTGSSDFPIVNAADATLGGSHDSFVTKLEPFLPYLPPYRVQIAYSTFLGGSGLEYVYDIAIDGPGAAVVVGQTNSSTFPRTAHTPELAGDWDCFVTKLSPSGSTFSYSSFLGGSRYDRATGIAIGADGSLYVTGITNSVDFPTTPRAYDRTLNGGYDLFVTKLRPALFPAPPYTIDYSTYLGGSNDDTPWDDNPGPIAIDISAIAVDSSGAAVIVAATQSTDYPLLNPLDSVFEPFALCKICVTKLRPAGNGLVYSTYLGGPFYDVALGAGVVVDASGAAYVVGWCNGAMVAKLE